MASLRDIRKRIKSVKNSQKITKAMKMVSAAKLRRAEQRVKAARPYADKLARTCAGLAKRAEQMGEAPHPLLTARPEAKKGGIVEILSVTSDRGLCGAFNSNVARRSLRQRFDLRDSAKEIRISTIGRKVTDAMKREKIPVRKHYERVVDSPSFDKARDIAVELSDAYVKGEIDALFLVYNEFVNASLQRVVVDQVLPIQPAEVGAGEVLTDHEYEPNRDELLSTLLPRQLATRIYRAVIESVAAEHAARMSAMDNASKNAKEMVDSLTLYANRVRQAAITKELMEIIGGAEALKG
ncbi:MAG: ATP synthase F1 subunit gamma [Deltaproteobacteria bacterium]|nr:ATP synthase F1 subunit gamma [Deltaproteobacteria bacterium]